MEKLVRDKIIQKIFSRGETPQFRQVSGQEKLEFLLEKLIEESLELKKDRNIEELADVEEVILALYSHLGCSKQEIEKARLQKLEKNGGFEEGYILTLPEMKPGIYKHYKGNLYEVIGLGHHSETLEELVFYKALYNSPDFGENSLWCRPKDMFLEKIEIDGVLVPRFEYLGD